MDPCLEKLEAEWGKLAEAKEWKKLGKCLRLLLNLLKSSDSLKEYEVSLAEKVKFLERSLDEMGFGEAAQVINDIRHARKNVKLATSGEFGRAFTQELSAKERATIRKRNRAPKLGVATALNGRKIAPANAGGDDI